MTITKPLIRKSLQRISPSNIFRLCAGIALLWSGFSFAESVSDEVLEKFHDSMVLIEGGEFFMGCSAVQGVCESDEHPLRRVKVASFELSKYEVTQEMWQLVMGTSPSLFRDCPQCPVETVSWNDIQQFLIKLNATGSNYRLPSEAEWEYAAKGGTLAKATRYAGGDDVDEIGWYYLNSNNRTHPVGEKLPNELGLFDMSGNVREWVQDCRQESYQNAPVTGEPWEVGTCERKSIRGGSWYGKPNYLRTANRFWYTPSFQNNNLGFRVARSRAH